jgi:hypothetical protein
VLVLAVLQLAAGCGQDVQVGVDDALVNAAAGGDGGSSAGSSGAAAGGSDAGAGGSMQAGAPSCEPTECRGQVYDCGNCQDDDQDGLVDAIDPDCLGPCDNDETVLGTGLSTTATGSCKQDCYFDGDNGPGNDKCEWSHRCDPLSVAPDFPPSGEERCAYEPSGMVMGYDCAALVAAQPQACLDNCLPLVPNGCDCFGCCEIPGASGEFHYVGLNGGDCRLDTVEDAAKCPPCTKVDSCFNSCDECEVCVGRTRPSSCDPQSACPSGQAACDGSNAPCDFGEYCVTGCCVRAPKPT